jgi:hypothetical protein
MTTSVKLSVTMRSALKDKYRAADLRRIDAALKAWIKAEKVRGIRTVHVALDSAVDMKAHGLKALSAPLTAPATKEAIDALARKLAPDYIVIVGGDDIVPYFRLRNPAFDPGPDGDPDSVVLSDNPYATSRKFNARSSKSYLVPDRVVGRLPDLPAGTGQGDPATLLAALATATKWKPQPRSFFKDIYATSTATWKVAGVAMMKLLAFPEADLMVAPPTKDASRTARNRLARAVHMTKCHGDDPDARFFGESLKHAFPPVLFSATLEKRVQAGRPGGRSLLLRRRHLRAGQPARQAARLACAADGRGLSARRCAGLHGLDQDRLRRKRRALVRRLDRDELPEEGARRRFARARHARGEAGLPRRPDPPGSDARQRRRKDDDRVRAARRSGDPSDFLDGAGARAGPVRRRAARRATLRSQRRVARVVVAAEVEQALPSRTKAASVSSNEAKAVFKAAAGLLTRIDAKVFDPRRAFVETVVTPARPATVMRLAGRPRAAIAGMARTTGAARQRSKEYTWWGRLPGKRSPRAAPRAKDATTAGTPIRLVVMKVQTDSRGNVIRSRILHGA